MIGDAFVGRLLLLASAYAPAAIIIGIRALPHRVGLVALGVGVLGLVAWAVFLGWLRHRVQPREVRLDNVQPIDPEVTGYIASYLLPIVAASSPDTGDVVAYAFCAALLLIVAFAADLGVVNPVVYVLGLRVVRAQIAGRPTVVLTAELPTSGATVTVSRRLDVVCVVRTTAASEG